ncbi:MAG: hypothetical protein AAF414_03290 [Pseudomonadota bacterium]
MVSTIIGAAAAGVASYHVFERGLRDAFNAQLELTVDEVKRVIDAGVRAGLTWDQPHLLLRALDTGATADTIGPREIISIVGEQGLIIASTNAAEIGEAPPSFWTVTDETEGTDPETILVGKPVISLFGTVEGLVVARVPTAIMNTPSEAFLFRVLIAITFGTLAVALVAAFALWLVPWATPRRTEALRDMMNDLYDRIGGSDIGEKQRELPKPIAATAIDFQETTLGLSNRLKQETDELNRLDEAA